MGALMHPDSGMSVRIVFSGVQEELENVCYSRPELNDRFVIVALHSEIARDEQQRAFQKFVKDPSVHAVFFFLLKDSKTLKTLH